MKTVKELYEEKNQHVAAMRAVDEKARKEDRALTTDEETTWNDASDKLDAVTKVISRAEKLERIENESRSSQREFNTGDEGGGGEPLAGTPEAENRSLDNWERSRRRVDRLSAEDRANVESVQKRAFNQFLLNGVSGFGHAEARALQMGDGTQGGYLVAPQIWVNELIQAIDNEVFMRGLATSFPIQGAHSLGFPTLDTDVGDVDWTSEVQAAPEDTALRFGKREFKTNPLSKLIKVSRTLMRQANAENIVRDRMGVKFGVAQENGFLLGDGQGKPLGVFTASDQGISTGRDVSSENTSTAITGNGLINAKFALKAKYWPEANWIFNPLAVRDIRKIKDSDGQYVWQAGLQQGVPDRILDVPYLMSEYAPSTFTTGLYVGIIGAFKNYYIADSLDMEIQRLDELYAVNNQTGFIGRMESDGMPVLEEAFIRVKLG